MADLINMGCNCCGTTEDECNFVCPSGTFPDLGSVTLTCEDLFTVTITEDPAPIPEPIFPPFLDDCEVVYFATGDGFSDACYGGGDSVKRYILYTVILEVKFLHDAGDNYIQFEGQLDFAFSDGEDCETVEEPDTPVSFFFASEEFLIEDCDDLPTFSCTLEDIPIYDETGTPILQDFNLVMTFP